MTTPTTNEQAAFNGAASVKPEPDTRVTHEEIMSQPWRYPQGRNVPPADEWLNLRLPFPEMLAVLVIWALAFGAGVSILYLIFSQVTA